MNAAIYTLWLATFATGQGGGSPVITPLATFQTQDECLVSLETVGMTVRKEYGKSQPMPGLLFCVYGVPVKR